MDSENGKVKWYYQPIDFIRNPPQDIKIIEINLPQKIIQLKD